MTSYAFWNNKGGVGKSFLCFITACEYAHKFPGSDVYVLDLCPQANVSEALLGGFPKGSKAMVELLARRPRASIAGYLVLLCYVESTKTSSNFRPQQWQKP